MWAPELMAEVGRSRCTELHAEAARVALVAAYAPRLTIARRVARRLGRALVWLGAALLRYGRDESLATPRVPRSPARPTSAS